MTHCFDGRRFIYHGGEIRGKGKNVLINAKKGLKAKINGSDILTAALCLYGFDGPCGRLRSARITKEHAVLAFNEDPVIFITFVGIAKLLIVPVRSRLAQSDCL